ncbi:MAG: aryl-alcohol dehydrogenase-like predicted oxidoreductase, partial [Porticoccaceae bacterium]
MKKNQLGKTDTFVSELCLGSMTWGTQNSYAEAA